MYRIGIEEQSGIFSGIVVDNRGSILFRETSNELSHLLKLLVKERNIHTEKIDYVSISTDIVGRILIDQKKFFPITIVRAGASENNFSYKSSEYFFRFSKEPSIQSFFLKGTVKLSGEEEVTLDSKELLEIGKSIKDNKDIKGVGIIGLFSNFFPETEIRISRKLREIVGKDLPICLSSDLSQKSLVYRESFLVSNLLLIQTASQLLSKYAQAVSGILGNIQLYFLKNDGSLLSSKTAIRYPIFLKDSALVSKIIGAVHSSKIPNIRMIMRSGNRIVQMSTLDSRPVIIKVRSSLRQEYGALFQSVFKTINCSEKNVDSLLINTQKKGNSTIVIDRNLLSKSKKWKDLGVFPMQIDGFLGAIGAASAPIRISADFLGSTQFQGRKVVLEEAKNKVVQKLVREGVEISTTNIIQADEIPVSYLPWFMLRTKISIEGNPRKLEQSQGH